MRGTAIGVVATAIFFAVLGAPAHAHTELGSSSPESGETLSEAPDVIELKFTSEAKPDGDGVQLFSSTGEAIASEVSQPEPDVVSLRPSSPLPNGDFTVTWSVGSDDGHLASGSFAFRIDAPDEPTDAPSEAEDPQAGAASTDTAQPDAPVTTTTEVAASSDGAGHEHGEDDPDAAAPVLTGSVSNPVEPVVIVAEGGTAPGEWLGRLGRWVAMVGALLGIGAVVFGLIALIGSRDEVAMVGRLVRAGGLLVVVGTAIEVIGAALVRASFGDSFAVSLAAVLSTSFGLAAWLRSIGGVGMLLFAPTRAALVADRPGEAGEPAIGRGGGQLAVARVADPSIERLDLRGAVPAILVLGVVVASYLFDGHTTTAEPSALVALADVVHIVAAGVWFGGVVTIVLILTGRKRRVVPLDAAHIALRFSRAAALSLAAVAVAGGALAFTILDSPSEVTSTAWGRMFIAKLALVAVAVALGAYNHFVVVPRMRGAGSDPEAGERLRRVTAAEGVVLVTVIACTAVLVALGS